MRATLGDLRRELGLRDNQIFDPNLQDRLGYHLLKRRGYDAFMAGRIDTVEFGKRLAMEWASLPVLAATKGAHRQLQRGQSYYSGDALNKSLVSPARVESILVMAKGDATKPTPPPRPAPSQPSGANPYLVVAFIVAAAIAYFILKSIGVVP